jgi:hypothetical protein
MSVFVLSLRSWTLFIRLLRLTIESTPTPPPTRIAYTYPQVTGVIQLTALSYYAQFPLLDSGSLYPIKFIIAIAYRRKKPRS